MTYNLNQVAMITGLTTRTLRNYLKQDLLKGEKIDGNWTFTEEEIADFMEEPSARQAIAARTNAVVYDFLANPFKKVNSICTILDLPVSAEEASETADFFCDLINRSGGTGISFKYVQERNFARYILSGPEDVVADFMKTYYER